MYEFFLKRDVTYSWTPLSQTVTPSRTPSPSSMTYFMDLPYVNNIQVYYNRIELNVHSLKIRETLQLL